MQDPFGVVRAVYRFAGMPLTEEARAAMWAWMERNPRNQRATHAYTLARFGLSQAQLERDFAAYRARHVLNTR